MKNLLEEHPPSLTMTPYHSPQWGPTNSQRREKVDWILLRSCVLCHCDSGGIVKHLGRKACVPAAASLCPAHSLQSHSVELTVLRIGSHVELTVIWFRVARWRGGRRWKGLTRSRTWPRLADIKKAMRINISKRMSGDVCALYHVKEVAVKHSRFHIFSNVLSYLSCIWSWIFNCIVYCICISS